MRDAAGDDVPFSHAALEGLEHAPDLGNHAAGDNAGGQEPLDFGLGDVRQEAGLVIGLPADAVGVGDVDQFLGLEGAGDGGSGLVGVAVVLLAIGADADRRDDGDGVEVAEAPKEKGVDVDDAADEAEVGAIRAAGRERLGAGGSGSWT